MTSSTTTRLAANPMQIHHCAKLIDPVTRIRCRNPIEVAAMIASSATPYRRSCVDPGHRVSIEDRVPLLARQQPRSQMEQGQRGEQHRGRDQCAVPWLADLVDDEGPDRHHSALGA